MTYNINCNNVGKDAYGEDSLSWERASQMMGDMITALMVVDYTPIYRDNFTATLVKGKSVVRINIEEDEE